MGEILKRLRHELKARANPDLSAYQLDSVYDGIEAKYYVELSDRIGRFAQILYVTLDEEDSSNSQSANSLISQVQIILQREVENIVGVALDAKSSKDDRVSVSTFSTNDEDEDVHKPRATRLEEKLAKLVLRKYVDDHAILLEEMQAQRRLALAESQIEKMSHLKSDAFDVPPGRRLGPVKALAFRDSDFDIVSHTNSSRSNSFKLVNDLGTNVLFASADGKVALPKPQENHQNNAGKDDEDSSDLDSDKTEIIEQYFEEALEDHDEESSVKVAAKNRRLKASRAKESWNLVYASSEDADSVASWEKEKPIVEEFTSEGGQPKRLPFNFGRIDWSANERSDPRFLEKPNLKISVLKGENVELKVTVDGTHPIDVFWYRLDDKNTVELKSGDKYEMHVDPVMNTHTLTIWHCTKHDIGAYLAIAVNQLRAVAQGTKIKVEKNDRAFKRPSFLEAFEDLKLRTGRTAKFNCKVVGYPPPRVTFLKDGKQIDLTNSDKYLINKSGNRTYVLLIRNLDLSDDAEYSCMLRNPSGLVQCDAQLLVYTPDDDETAIKKIESEIKDTHKSMVTAAKDMHCATGRLKQMDSNFDKLNKKLNRMENDFVAMGNSKPMPEAEALQQSTDKVIDNLINLDSLKFKPQPTGSSTPKSNSVEASPASQSTLPDSSHSSHVNSSLSMVDSYPIKSPKIVYDVENFDTSPQDDNKKVESSISVTSERHQKVYQSTARTSALRAELDDIEAEIRRTPASKLNFQSAEKTVEVVEGLACENEDQVSKLCSEVGEEDGEGPSPPVSKLINRFNSTPTSSALHRVGSITRRSNPPSNKQSRDSKKT